MGVSIPRKGLGDHRGFDRIQSQALGIAWALGVHDIAVRRHTPGQQLPTAQFGLAATSHPVSDEGAFILGHRAADLEQELIVRT